MNNVLSLEKCICVLGEKKIFMDKQITSAEVTAVIVTYNRLKYLKECVNALLNQSVKLSTIIIVNNNSTDSTASYLEKLALEEDNIKIFNLDQNLGGAGGFSFGLKHFILQSEDEFVWIMDDDTIPTETALENLIVAQDIFDSNYSFLASNVRWIDNTPAKMNIPTIDGEKWIDFMGVDNKNYPKLRRATFVSLFVPRKMIEKVGLPIKEFFIWGDDSEYTERLFREKPGFFVPDSLVIHKMQMNQGASIVDDASEKERLNRYYYAFRNRVYYSKFIDSKEKAKVRLKILNDLKSVIFKKSPNKLTKIKMIIKGVFAGVFFHPEIEYVKKNN